MCFDNIDNKYRTNYEITSKQNTVKRNNLAIITNVFPDDYIK